MLLQANLPIMTYPLYHSSYETFFAYDTFIDPGFVANAAMTKVWGVMTRLMFIYFKFHKYKNCFLKPSSMKDTDS